MDATVLDYVTRVRAKDMGEPLGTRDAYDAQYSEQLQHVVDRCVGDQGGLLHSEAKLVDIRRHFVECVAALLHPNVLIGHPQLDEKVSCWLRCVHYAVANYLECRGRGWARIDPFRWSVDDAMDVYRRLLGEIDEMPGERQLAPERKSSNE